MNQGILAAAGIIALEKMTGRLIEDHENAKYLADELSKACPMSSETGSWILPFRKQL
jgi:threonine aldolase